MPQKFSACLQQFPPEIQNKYQTPERIVAFLIGRAAHRNAPRCHRNAPRDDAAVELIEFKFFDDPTIRKDGLVYIRDPGGWKYALPTDVVARLVTLFNSKSSK